MVKITNWSPAGEDRWEHDKYDLEAFIEKEEAKDVYDREFFYVGKVFDNEIGNEQYLYRNISTSKKEARSELIDFLKRSPYTMKKHVMSSEDAVRLITRGFYSGYPWIEPDGRMPEEEGGGEFGPGETVQGATQTLGDYDAGIINSIVKKTVESGFYSKVRDNREVYVVVGDSKSEVKDYKEYAESLLEDPNTEYFQWDDFFERAEDDGIVFEETGRYQDATVHETEGDKEIVETSNKAFVAEEI
jgi:hypothetical protein